MLPRHEATGASREGGEGGSPESEDLSRSSITGPLVEGGPRCYARPFSPSSRPLALLAVERCRRPGRKAGAEAVPRHDHDPRRQGHRQEEAPPHRLALPDRDRDAVRDRRRQAGDRGRQPVRLPEERAEDVALRLHAERRGDRGLPAGPRRHRVRHEGARVVAPQAEDHGRPPRRREDAEGRVHADPPARHGHRQRRRGHDARQDHAHEDRRDRGALEEPRSRQVRLPRAHARPLLGDLEHVHREGVRAARAREHRGRGRLGRHGLPAALRGVRRRGRPGRDRARGHRLLRPEAVDRRRAAGLGSHQRRPHGLDRAHGRLDRVPLGPAARELLPRDVVGARALGS